MTADAERLVESQPPVKRRLRNLLLDPRFQLKYTGMVIAVTLVVAGVLGFVAYRYSTGQTQMMAIMQMEMGAQMSADTAHYLQREAEAADRRVLTGILGGIALLVSAVGMTGILVTHRLVGPAYKIKRLLAEVRDGHLRVDSRLRKGDELQDVFEAFEGMVASLRARQAEEVRQLDAALAEARQAGAPNEVLREVEAVRNRMQAELD